MFIKRSYLFLMLLLCFLFGGVSATVYETLAAKDPRRSRHVRTSDVVKQIDMSEAQRTQLNTLLEEGRKRMVALNASMRPEMLKIRQEVRGQIREILSSDQRTTLDQLIAKQDSARYARTDTVQSSRGSGH